jgi:hypothetical protein
MLTRLGYILAFSLVAAARGAAQSPQLTTTTRYSGDTLWTMGRGEQASYARREVFHRGKSSDTLTVSFSHADTTLWSRVFVFKADSIWLVGGGLLTGSEKISPRASRSSWLAHLESERLPIWKSP